MSDIFDYKRKQPNAFKLLLTSNISLQLSFTSIFFKYGLIFALLNIFYFYSIISLKNISCAFSFQAQ